MAGLGPVFVSVFQYTCHAGVSQCRDMQGVEHAETRS